MNGLVNGCMVSVMDEWVDKWMDNKSIILYVHIDNMFLYRILQ